MEVELAAKINFLLAAQAGSVTGPQLFTEQASQPGLELGWTVQTETVADGKLSWCAT
jgi:hypothetical protein